MRPDDHLTPRGEALAENSGIDPGHEAMIADLTPGKPEPPDYAYQSPEQIHNLGLGKDVADVIRDGVRKAVLVNPSDVPLRTLPEIARELEDWAGGIKPQVPELAKLLYEWAYELRTRHDHADPCDDEYCPCYKAARDWERDQGRGPR